MCEGGPAQHRPATASLGRDPEVTIPLQPVDSVELLSLIDNVTDVFMPDQGPAKRAQLAFTRTRPAAFMQAGWVPEPLVAEHGFSLLVTVTKAGRTHRVLFDTGTSPDGVVENMRRLDVDPGSIEAIVCSHGHFDHTAGLAGLMRAVSSLPVIIHPEFWHSRRVV